MIIALCVNNRSNVYLYLYVKYIQVLSTRLHHSPDIADSSIL